MWQKYYQTQTLEQKRNIYIIKSGLGYIGYQMEKFALCFYRLSSHAWARFIIVWNECAKLCKLHNQLWTWHWNTSFYNPSTFLFVPISSSWKTLVICWVLLSYIKHRPFKCDKKEAGRLTNLNNNSNLNNFLWQFTILTSFFLSLQPINSMTN